MIDRKAGDSWGQLGGHTDDSVLHTHAEDTRLDDT